MLNGDTSTLRHPPTAVITGASSGIGQALASVLAENGYNLILMARRSELIEEWAQFLSARFHNIKIKTVVSDVTDHQKHMQDVREASAEFASLDLVIANAGVGIVTNEWENTWEKSFVTFQTNLLGAIATIEAAKDIMLKQGQGHIVGISSMAAIRGLAQTSAYCASKAGLAVFLESMRTDLIQKNITVTSVHPGFIETPMTKQNGKMPWLMNAEQAARVIFLAIQNKKSRLYFPWQMHALGILLRILPNPVFDFVMRLSRKKTQVFKAKRA